MPIVGRAVEQEEYDAWMAEKQQEAADVCAIVGKEGKMDELMEEGESV